ncbi:bifunctional ADP-dependent NAD(P)H-hydrate dehydratase/NAD(P)H-hydrate epimerase [Bifidobacterium sp. B4001]|uniref:bifunctional ADP-dependent NAD(P)H-hydrate dehydratase/NAD(P)H-hydrate epimerase n=1 Tax=unclassified Bifidobacterium TaxID=2608897 RepID=UPI00226B8B53|nr:MULTISPECIES: bifunctional ADP-dependent NAD(P)H-hydrate dehydratase/NAD(P)H-hydrate epimerase [unclassified Bifidobacterium]MCX8672297.1 bifunctional ADP-dependent NAD(P)H-hydrate dehydratase/NAD(P)H-hydrate epimerase [Bifidobacterium sp. B4079]MCX8680731.1 bifunctional ADP-dependent NAD(P)H-hydrate dehydratase/NAD(P)H-hydrate epimerase [Bifidobacterium sp. B4001]
MKPSPDERREARRILATSAYSADMIRSLEQPFLDDGVPLMRIAAGSLASVADVMLTHAGLEPTGARIVLLAGAGNNGGDGLYASADLARHGADVTVVAAGRSLHQGGLDALLRAGGVVTALDPQAAIPGCEAPVGPNQATEELDQALELCRQADLIIDAMTGIGLKGALRGIPAALASELGMESGLPDRPAWHDPAEQDGPLVLAVDTPSGVDIDEGTLPGAYIPADVTVTMGAMKPCLMLPPAAYVCGRIVLVDFGFDTSALAPSVSCMNAEDCAGLLRAPRVDDTKYSRGVVGLVTGSALYHGAGLLSSRAAASGNAGMIRYCGPGQVGDLILQELPETVLGRGRVESWVLGSGVPTRQAQKAAGPEGQDGQRDLIADILSQQAADLDEDEAAADPPVVADAGALDLLPDRLGPRTVLTPHAGEMAALLNSHGENVDGEQVMAEPLHWAVRACQLTGATILLKGAITLIVGDDGTDRPRVMTTGFGPAWLSTAGSGDVLSGAIGAMLAQNAGPIQDDATLMVDLTAAAAFLHGLAGSLASGGRQTGWEQPLIFDPRKPQDFADLVAEGNQPAGQGTVTGRMGQPIRAGQVADALPRAIGLVMSRAVRAAEQIDQPIQDGEDASLFFENSSLWF